MVERLYPVKSVAAVLGVGKDTVYRLIKSGEIAAVRLTTDAAPTRIAESELDRYIESLPPA